MIENWDLISRIDEKTGNVLFSLVMDGTEKDARIMAKKLAGYAGEPMPAEAPFIYALELPNNLDSATQDKICAAAQECAQMTRKVNKFMPGGVVGDPLFNNTFAQETKDFPTFLALSPSDSFFNDPKSPEKPKGKADLSLTFVEQLPLGENLPKDQAQTVSAKVPEEVQIKNTDELTTLPTQTKPALPDQSAPAQPTTENVVAETPVVQQSATTQSQKESTDNLPLQVRVRAAEFETEPIKDMPVSIDLTENAEPPTQDFSKQQETEPDSEEPIDPKTITLDGSAQTTPTITDQDMLISDMEDTLLGKNPVPLEDIFASETKYDMFVDVQNELKTQKNQLEREEKLNQVNAENTGSFDIFAQNLKEQTNVIDLTNLQEMLNKMPTEKKDTSVSAAEVNVEQFEKQTVDIPAQDANIPHATLRVDTPEDLPEITLRTSPLTNDQTNTSPVEDPLEQIEQADRENEMQPSDSLRTQKDQLSSEEENLAVKETFMEDKNAKTTFRIKPKIKIPPAVKQPQPPKPASPRPPLPKAPVAPKPAIPGMPSAPKAVPTSNEAEPGLEKTKTIDHSIQLPLSELKKHTWPLEIPLIPTYTLNNMVMSVNRFAHATAISVIESPGKLYNPLVFHGSTGTGKTHFLNAMAYAFSQKFGQPNIFMTNGVRLSRGVQRYIMEGKIEKFDQFMSTVKVLLIDDIHLLAINEQNRAYISKLLNTFLKERKQIVITSKYPPESLEKLEELIKFKLDSGWISELKPATGSAYVKIVKKMLLDNNVDLTDSQMEQFFAAKHMTLGTVMRSIRRLKALENLIPEDLNIEKRSQAALLEKLIPLKGEDTSSRILSMDAGSITSISQQGNGEWGRIGFFYPANCSDQMNWMVYALQQRAKELGIQSNFEIVVRSSYATENIISSAFKIANLCDNKNYQF